MKKNICFLVSERKTLVFEKIEKKINNFSNVYWISPNKRWINWLLKKNIDKKNILDLSKFNQSILINEDDYNFLEQKFHISFNKIISMDRILRRTKKNLAKKYIYYCFMEIEKFIKDNNINLIYSEQTWAFELICTHISLKIKAKSFFVDTVKVPGSMKDGRIAFFEGYTHSSLPNYNQVNDYHTVKARNYLNFYRDNKPEISYLSSFIEIPKIFKFINVLKLSQHLSFIFTDNNDFTKNNLFYLIKIKLLKYLRNLYLKLIFKFDKFEDTKKAIVIFYHKEPDSAVDVISEQFTSQFEFIKKIYKLTPSNYNLFIKLHPHAIGLTTLDEIYKYKKLNIKILNPKINSSSIMLKSSFVFSLCGTASLEAALFKIKSGVLTKMFYSEILEIPSLLDKNFTYNEFITILKKDNISDDKIIKYLSKVFANSYKGIFLDPSVSQTILSEDNISKLAFAFTDHINKF